MNSTLDLVLLLEVLSRLQKLQIISGDGSDKTILASDKPNLLQTLAEGPIGAMLLNKAGGMIENAFAGTKPGTEKGIGSFSRKKTTGIKDVDFGDDTCPL